ncbi:long-chain-fatty-acid--CoA/3-oxocholest-4-en-26-oate--CoA ligase [Pseudonocardia sulfidoxydans NBRC 16205]|uniref:Long-chain-fatty-acid--CoA/3-oxocholest-4-en-26-oate--CoA ligase n=1 Tax=Pseudonocardia sulfidoxydans NBRC 16205 TaxID=1223511 RepID=A0A511DJI9_9PSEU|nr:AMP-binding protein [Pseudonocardia sulfidoxydans]GEL24587.1 long-chain-fatty-acid--CoA/3-oxocholest-4-en-26-oate--CoA ligase [Pseudonocardia sulfidoxydans NBRC 16205]
MTPLPDDLATHFELVADLAPDRLAVACGDESLTWGAFEDSAARLAGWLAGHGIGDGDRVAMMARNSPGYLVALFAIWKLRATMVNVNYRYRAEEAAYVLADADAKAVIADEDLLDVARAPIVARLGDGVDGPPLPRTERDGDREWLLYTGGTTGNPKAVVGSHTERCRTAQSGTLRLLGLDRAEGVDALRAALAVDPKGPDGIVWLPAPPLMHGTGLYSALGSLAGGAPVALLPGRSTSGEDLASTIDRHGVTDLTIVGDAFALRLLDALDADAAADRPSRIASLRRIRSIGAVWSPAVKRRLLTHADLALHDSIAASEGGLYAVSVVTRDTPDDRLGGFELAAGARLLDEDDHDVVPGSGVVGLLAAPVVENAGYAGDPEKTAGAFRDLGGVRLSIPGDMARLGADGRLELLGRGSSVINTGGEKVYADEVEIVLREHPAVRDVVVVGVPDPTYGSVVGAVVALEQGREADPDTLRDFVSSRLASYKKPRRLLLAPEVERLASGKADLRWARRRLL